MRILVVSHQEIDGVPAVDRHEEGEVLFCRLEEGTGLGAFVLAWAQKVEDVFIYLCPKDPIPALFLEVVKDLGQARLAGATKPDSAVVVHGQEFTTNSCRIVSCLTCDAKQTIKFADSVDIKRIYWTKHGGQPFFEKLIERAGQAVNS